MTPARHRRPAGAETLDGAIAALRAGGLRVSAARRLVLEALGLVRHMHLGHGPGRYVLTGRDDRGSLACERCGALVAAAGDALAPLRALVRESFGFEARFGHFPIVGLCAACAATEAGRG
jgi:Fur family transcriptional regulator, ferric uptake regulator